MGKIGLFALIVLTGVVLITAAYCQEDVITIRGEIAAMDWVGSSLSVRWFDEASGNYDQMVFTVPDNVEVFKNGGKVSFFDLHLSDRVTVKYVDNSFAGLKVVSITVTD